MPPGRRQRATRPAGAILAALVALPLLIVAVAASDPDGNADAALPCNALGCEIRLSTAGPLGPVTVIGDSVLLGSGLWGSIQPTLPDRLVEQGWGPIRFRATVGLLAGPVGSSSNSAGWRIENWRAGGWDPQDLIVNIGANDSGLCRTNLACARTRIEQFLDTVGPGHRIWWPKVTQSVSQTAWATTWNAALDQIAAERPDVYLWDWPTELATGGYSSPDNIHLSVASYAKRSLRMAEQFTLDRGVRDFGVGSSGPLGAVSVIGDSVVRGSGVSGPTLPDRLVESGWGPVKFRGDPDLQAGAAVTDDDAAWWLRGWRAGGWDAPNVIVNVGLNDSAVCQTDPGCARARMIALLDEIGPGHRVWWPQITQTAANTAWADTWNSALTQLASERNDLFSWDWPTEMATGGYTSSDGVHLTTAGYQQRSMAIATAFTHDLTRSVRVGGDATLPTPTTDPSTYLPLIPARIADTRPGRQPAGSTLTIDFGNRLPPGASAVAITVTATRALADGYLTAGPCGTATNASTVNYTASTDRAAMAVTPLGTNDDVCIYTSSDTDIVVDLQGAFVADGGSKLTPRPTQARIADTRTQPGLLTDTLIVPTPPDATAVAVNLTVDHATASGFLTAVPCGTAATVSNVNFGPAEAVAGATYITTSPDHTICITTSTPADVIVDLTATFGPDGLSFTPVTPTRMLDTRNTIGGWTPIHGNDQTLDITVTPPDAAAVTGTITEVGPLTNGYLTAFACPTRPNTSAVNATAGHTLANSLTTAVSATGQLCIYANPTTHTLLDITGWWTP